MHEMSMMGMSQIGAQVIIIRSNFDKNEKKFPNKDSCMLDVIHRFVFSTDKKCSTNSFKPNKLSFLSSFNAVKHNM